MPWQKSAHATLDPILINVFAFQIKAFSFPQSNPEFFFMYTVGRGVCIIYTYDGKFKLSLCFSTLKYTCLRDLFLMKDVYHASYTPKNTQHQYIKLMRELS